MNVLANPNPRFRKHARHYSESKRTTIYSQSNVHREGGRLIQTTENKNNSVGLGPPSHHLPPRCLHPGRNLHGGVMCLLIFIAVHTALKRLFHPQRGVSKKNFVDHARFEMNSAIAGGVCGFDGRLGSWRKSSYLHKTRVFSRNVRVKAASSVTSSTAVDLTQWMKENGTKDIHVDIQTAEVGGRVIDQTVARHDLNAGDVAMSIPEHLIVTLDRVFEDESLAELLTTSKLSELACLTLYMMYEKKESQDSFWYQYIKELDRQRARGQQGVESPILWPEGEADRLLAGSPVLQELKMRVDGILKEYEECDTVWYLAGSLFNKYPYDIPTEAFSATLFKQAFTAIQACVVHLQNVELSKRFALVPLGPPLVGYSSTSKAMLKYNPASKSVDLVVDRDYKEGEPIYAWCGPQPNKRLLINYGIVDESNPYDWLQVTATIPNTDPLFARKRHVLLENGLATQQVFRLQRGKPLPEPLIPFLRLAYVTEEGLVSQVNFSEGGRPVNEHHDSQILHQLVEYFQNRLDQYRTSIAEDDVTINSAGSNPREVVAAKLVRIEKEILNSAKEQVLSRQTSPGAGADSSSGSCAVILS